MFLIGVLSAIGASALFNGGVVLQALEARATSREKSLRLSLLQVLFRRPLWVLGFALGLIGVVPQVIALRAAPFVVVQPLLAVGLLLVLFLGTRLLGETVRAADWAAVGAIVVGVLLVALGAPPHSEAHRGGVVVVAIVAALSIPALLPLLRLPFATSPNALIVASGLGYAATNIAAKLFGDDVALRHWSNAATWAAVAAVDGVAATLTSMSAFQVRPATLVVPVSTAVQTFLPIALEPLFLRERAPTAPEAVALTFGLVLCLAGTVQLARSPAVATFVAGRPTRR